MKKETADYLNIKYKTSFKLDWLTVVFILGMVFLKGVIVTSTMEDKFVYVLMLMMIVAIVLLNNMVRTKVK